MLTEVAGLDGFSCTAAPILRERRGAFSGSSVVNSEPYCVDLITFELNDALIGADSLLASCFGAPVAARCSCSPWGTMITRDERIVSVHAVSGKTISLSGIGHTKADPLSAFVPTK